MNAIDTNVWLYSHDSRYPDKQLKAQGLIAVITDLVLPWQVGCEFIAACRKLGPSGFSEDNAWAALDRMKLLARGVAMPEPGDWARARALQRSDMLSFWDALLLVACMRAGVKVMYSEDMGAPRTVGAISIVNPF